MVRHERNVSEPDNGAAFPDQQREVPAADMDDYEAAFGARRNKGLAYGHGKTSAQWAQITFMTIDFLIWGGFPQISRSYR